MARVFITGSSDGLGLLAGQILARQGHEVILHARNAQRADAARAALPACEAVAVGDVSSMAETRAVADQVNALGRCDAVIHNVAVGSEKNRVETADGLSRVFAVNVVAPYLLTALVERPDRLIYMSSGMHLGGSADLDDPQWEKRSWNGWQAYSDSKLHDLILALALARRWPDTIATRSTRAGCRPEWAVRVRPTTSSRESSPKPGWRSATILKRKSQADICTIRSRLR
jgi:NAD(P)-dependent dehydrogenase (short-subunit alcohol dehydrogenase family)